MNDIRIPDRDRMGHFLSLLTSTWRLPLAFGLLIGIVLLLGLLVARWVVPSTTTYLARFEFKFPGVEAGNFPNGDRFSLNELIEPNIVGIIYDRQALDKFGIDRDEFFNGLAVRPYVPQEEEITARFQQQLADRRLTLTERERIEAQLKRILDQNSKGGAEVALTLRNRIDIPKEVGRSIVQAIPLVWSEYMIQKRGVLRLPDFSGANEALPVDAVKKMTASIGILQLIEASDQFRDRLTLAKKIGGIQTAIDPKTQKSIRDLASDFNNLELFEINPLRASLPTISQIDGTDRIRAVAQEKLRSLQVEEDYNMNISKALTSTMDQFVQGIASLKGRSETRRVGSEAAGTGSSGSSTIPQLSEGFIDKLVDMSTRGRESEDALQRYVSSLAEQQLSTAEMLARIRSQQNNWRTLIESLKPNDMSATRDQGSRSGTLDNLLTTVSELNNQWAALNRLELEFSANRLLHTGRLYNLFYTSPDIIRYNPIANLSVLLLCVASTFFVFTITWLARIGVRYFRSES